MKIATREIGKDCKNLLGKKGKSKRKRKKVKMGEEEEREGGESELSERSGSDL